MSRKNALELASMVERYNAGVHSQAIVEDYQYVADVLRQQHNRLLLLEQALRNTIHDLRLNADMCPLWATEEYEKILFDTSVLTSIDVQRKDFENWAESEGFYLNAFGDGQYIHDVTHFAWKAWQAAKTNKI